SLHRVGPPPDRSVNYAFIVVLVGLLAVRRVALVADQAGFELAIDRASRDAEQVGGEALVSAREFEGLHDHPALDLLERRADREGQLAPVAGLRIAQLRGQIID